MAEITAKLVNELRAKTGQGMMECKKMLTEVGGDIDKAIEAFRRELDEGMLASATLADGSAEVVRELPLDADLVVLRRPIAGG